MGKARVFGPLLLIGAAWSEGAWAASCAVGPVCVGDQDHDSLAEAIHEAQEAAISQVEVMASYDPTVETSDGTTPCAQLAFDGATDIHVMALSDDVRWPGIKVNGGALAITGGRFVGACALAYSERVSVYDDETSESLPELQSFTTTAQLIAVESDLSVVGVTFDYLEATAPDDFLGAMFLWDSSLDASASTTITGYPRQGAVELVAHDEDVFAAFTDVTFSSNLELALVMRLTLSASMERLDSDGIAAEPRFDAALTDVEFLSNSPGYGLVADIYTDELASLGVTRGLHIGLGDGLAIYALDTWVTLTNTAVHSYERGLNVGAADGIIPGALDEQDDVGLDVEDSSFGNIHNSDAHGGAITASSGAITLSGVTASGLSSQNAPFVKAYYAPSLLVEDLTLTTFTVGAAPSAAIHAEQVDSVILRRAVVCDGQSSTSDAGGGLALYVNGLGGPEQSVEVHNLAFWGNRFGDGMFPAAVYAEDVKYFTVLHSSFVGSDEPTGRDAYAVRLINSKLDRDRFDIANNLIQGLTKGHYVADGYTFSDGSASATYNLFYEVDVPAGVGTGSYDLSTSYVNVAAPGLWSSFNAVDCTTPPLLGYRAYAIDKGDPDRTGEGDGSAPDLGAYGGPYAWELPDADGDGYVWGVDCDDTDASIYPGKADLRVDGIDSNCDGNDSPWDEPIYEEPGDDDSGIDDTGADDTGADDSAEPGPEEPLEFDYFGGRSCGGGAVDTGAAALVFLGTFTRRRRRWG
ncbi:MAG: hypothetical protein RIT28_1354 [Pseudomonadota bacterium]